LWCHELIISSLIELSFEFVGEMAKGKQVVESSNDIEGAKATGASLKFKKFNYDFWGQPVSDFLTHEWQRQRYHRHETKKWTQSKYVDMDFLRKKNIDGPVMGLLNGIGWSQALSTPFATYEGMTLEFYSTYREHTEDGEVTIISFQLCGKKIKMPVGNLGSIFGFDTYAPSDESEVKAKLQFKVKEVWSLFGIDPSRVKKTPRASMLGSAELAYVHRLLTTTICGRGDSTGNVTDSDTFLLYYMMHNQQLNGVPWLLKMFNRVSTMKSGRICGGGFVTAIAVALGFKEDREKLKPMSTRNLLGEEIMSRVLEHPSPKGKGKEIVEEESHDEEDEDNPGWEEEMIVVKDKKKVIKVDDTNVYSRYRRSKSIPPNMSERARTNILEARKRKNTAMGFMKTCLSWVKNMWSEADRVEKREFQHYEEKNERRSKRAHDPEDGSSHHRHSFHQ
jgi:hypothetical protein